jgi:glutamate synthase (NADPH) small chain
MATKKRTIRTIPQERTPMPEQDPKVRAKNFQEVACGYRLEDALREAERCLQCPDEPCVRGCPVSIDIPAFIQKITEKHYHGAYDVITDTNLLPSICGRVCPQESQCEGVCTVGETLEPVAIGRLERFVGDMAIAEGWENVPYIEPSGYKVGIVGAGPAGMACAADMAKAGCEVIVYEAFHTPGGVLKYGIPDFRLPNDVIDAEIEKLRNLGVRFECNTLVGRLFTIEQMVTEMGFHAVFIGTGAGYPSFMGIPGESLNGVLSANELLTRCNLMRGRDFPNFDTPLQPGKHVAVIGAGNTAMDALRVSLRLGAESVHCIYRRSKKEAPARVEEIHHAEEEGVDFNWLTAPVEILGDANNNVRALRCVKMELGEPDESGRRRPVVVPGQRIRVRGGHGRVRDRNQRQPDPRPDVEPQAEQVGLHRRRRQPRDLDRGCLGRRRHRHRGRHRDPGNGRGPPGCPRDEGLPRPARQRLRVRRRQRRFAVRHPARRARLRADQGRLTSSNKERA